MDPKAPIRSNPADLWRSLGPGQRRSAVGMIVTIAAIDNTTRKLLTEGKKPMSVGFGFSLGHTTIVFVLVALLAFGLRQLASSLADDNSGLETWTGLFGTAISGTFLLAIGLLNLLSLIGIYRVFQEMTRGNLDEAALERELDSRGALNTILGPLVGLVRKPWHMYLVGLLFVQHRWEAKLSPAQTHRG